MLSKKVILKEADFAGFKVVLDGVSVFQMPTLEMAVTNAKTLDADATEFELIKKDGSKEVVK